MAEKNPVFVIFRKNKNTYYYYYYYYYYYKRLFIYEDGSLLLLMNGESAMCNMAEYSRLLNVFFPLLFST